MSPLFLLLCGITILHLEQKKLLQKIEEDSQEHGTENLIPGMTEVAQPMRKLTMLGLKWLKVD